MAYFVSMDFGYAMNDIIIASEDEQEIYPSITTNSGKTYLQCKIIETSLFEIKVRHSRGIVKIPYSDIPESDRKKYGYDPEKAAAYIAAEEIKTYVQNRQQEYRRRIESIPYFSENLYVGKIGFIDGNIEIIQVIDENNFLGKMPIQSNTKNDDDYKLVWFSGFSTKNFADGQKIRSYKIFKVTGTKKYPTILGASKTVFVLEKIELSW